VVKLLVFSEQEFKMEGMKKKLMVVAVGLAILPIFLGSAFAYDKIFLVGNQASLDLAKDFISTMNNESIPLAIVTDQLDKVKTEKYIIVLGGTKGQESAAGFTKQVLTVKEQEEGNQPGGKMFVKENVFAPGQVIIIFAGPDDAAAANARKSNRKAWWQYIAKWFELETSVPMAY
jgi:hypothetical protein